MDNNTWTLPANLAISAHPDFTYVLFDYEGTNYVCVKSLLETLKLNLV